jgi:hypothetical protein
MKDLSCEGCIYEIYQGAAPSCAQDMRYGRRCRFFEEMNEEKQGVRDE